MITAAYPLCWLQTFEEARSRRAIARIARDSEHDLYTWACTTGLEKISPSKTVEGKTILGDISPISETNHPVKVLQKIREISAPSIFVLFDFRHYTNDAVVMRAIRDIVPRLKSRPSMILFVGPTLPLPPELEHEVAQVELPLPDLKELRKILLLFNDKAVTDLDEPSVEEICKAARGLTSDEAETSFALAISEGDLTPDNIWSNKARVVSSDALTFIEAGVTSDQIGGLDALKEWLTLRGGGFSDKACEYGLPTPRGVLIAGIPGTGKSLTAKAASSILNCPTLRLSIGACMRSLVGESEAALRGAIKRAESIALLHHEARLKPRLMNRLDDLAGNFRKIIDVNRNLGFFTTGYNYLIQIIPVLLVAPLFIQGRVEFGVVTQSTMAFAMLVEIGRAHV
jgi:hypothetical protein